MAEVSEVNRGLIQEIIQLALDPDVMFPSNVERVLCHERNFEWPTGSYLIKMECQIPLAYVPDQIGRRWLQMWCEHGRNPERCSLRNIADIYNTSHRVVGRRIQWVLDRAVDLADQRVAYFILDVYREQFGKGVPPVRLSYPQGEKKAGSRGQYKRA